MKYFNYVVICLVGLATFHSCSSDDNNSDSTFDLTGTWRGTAVSYDTTSTVTVQDQSFITTCDGEGFDLNFQITFSSGPNEYNSTGDFSVALTCVALGQTFEDTAEDISFLGNGQWRFENGDLILQENNEDEEVILEIVQLSSGAIQLTAVETESFEDNSISTVNTISIVLILERV